MKGLGNRGGNRSPGSGGMGRRGGGGAGAGGSCICPQCGTRVPHQTGIPCSQVRCPQCGTNMVQEGVGVS